MAQEPGRGAPDGACVFCALVERGEDIFHADEHCVAFLDHAPASEGHTLVVPRRHVVDLFEAGPELAGAVMATAQQVAVVLRERLGADGLTVRQNNGEASGQVVHHLHVHLVPRWHGDGTIGWPTPRRLPAVGQTAARLRGGA